MTDESVTMARVFCSCGAPMCTSNGYIPVTKDRPMKLHLYAKSDKSDHMKFGRLNKFGYTTTHNKMASKTKKRRNQSALKLMAELGSESNAHGLAKIATSGTTKRKVLWALLVIIGFTAATLQLSLLVNKFLLFQVVEVSNMKDGMPVEFPSVTICNIATISLNKVNKLLDPNNTDFRNDTAMKDWFEYIYKTNFGEQNARLNTHQAFYENLPEIAKYIGHDINHFVVNCRFNQHECSPSNFSIFFDGKNYYNCYTFNDGYDAKNKKPKHPKLQMHTTGPQNGLSLIISLDNEDPQPGTAGLYDPTNHIAFSAGVRAQVHAQNTMPSPADHGFDVPPGYSSSVGLKAILHSRKPFPYGNCSDNELEGDRWYRNTIFSCLQLCKQRIIVRECACQTSALPTYKEILDDHEHIPFCGRVKNWQLKAKENTSEETEQVYLEKLDCEERMLENLANDRSYEKTCNCFQPCSETSYQKSLSLSYWPLEFYHLTGLEEFFKDGNFTTKVMKEASDKLKRLDAKYSPMARAGNHTEFNRMDMEDYLRASTLIRQNLLRLNIYLEDLSIIEFLQMPAYDLADLFADIGGTLGLWMGISVLTIMELIELVIRLVMLLFNVESDVSGTDCDSDETPETQACLEHNNISHNNKYDQFHYDRPLYQHPRYDKHSESPI